MAAATSPTRRPTRPRGWTYADLALLARMRFIQGADTAALAAHYRTTPARITTVLSHPTTQSILADLAASLDDRVALAYRTLQHCAHRAAQNIEAAVDGGDLRESRFVLETLMPKQVIQQHQGTVEHNHHHTVAAQLITASVTKLTELMGRAPAAAAPEQYLLSGREGLGQRALQAANLTAGGGAPVRPPTGEPSSLSASSPDSAPSAPQARVSDPSQASALEAAPAADSSRVARKVVPSG